MKVVARTRNRGGHGKRYPLTVCDIYGIGGRPFLASLVSTTLSTAKRGGVATVQVHTGHVQERLVTLQYYDGPHLLLFAVHRPFSEMSIHGFVVQYGPREAGRNRKRMPLTARFQFVKGYTLDDLREVTFCSITAFCHR